MITTQNKNSKWWTEDETEHQSSLCPTSTLEL